MVDAELADQVLARRFEPTFLPHQGRMLDGPRGYRAGDGRRDGGLGGLDEEYFDQRRRPSFETLVSSEMSDAEKADALEGMTGPDEDWGAAPLFVINFDPNDKWKKVLIINTDNDVATFRSITEDPDYMPRKVLRPDADWWLDNSMMDANVQQMRAFHLHLRNYLAGE